jgi:hypothetical protein
MKTNLLKNILITAAAACSLAAFARADVPVDNAPLEATTPVRQGLLGQKYATLTYSYHHLDDSPTHADSFAFAFNQPLNTGLDALFSYDWAQTGLVAGERLNVQSVMAGLRAFSNAFSWGKPYAEAGAGYAWERFGGVHDDSFVWQIAGGVEFQLAPAFSLTPYVLFADAPELVSEGSWNVGVKANYWVDSQWSVTGGIALDDDQNTSFTVGTNFRF